MKRKLAALALIFTAITLTGCDTQESPDARYDRDRKSVV